MKNNEVVYTSISELVEQLLKIKENFGDLPVCCQGASPVHAEPRAYYYDGGYKLQDVKDRTNFKRSRSFNGTHTVKSEGFADYCVDIFYPMPEAEDKLDNRRVREIDPDSWDYVDEMECEERKFFDGQIVQYTTLATPDEKGYYSYQAYVSSGQIGIGRSMNMAKEELMQKYSAKK